MTRLRSRGVSAATLAFLSLLIVAALALPQLAHAQGTGKLIGRVTDSSTGSGISGVAVQIPALKRGANTGDDGRFVLDLVPTGTYQVRLSHIGYTGVTREGIVIKLGQETRLDLKLKPEVLQGQEISVSGKKKLVDVKVPTSQHTILAEDIKNAALKDLNDLLQKQAGVVKEDNELHIRGGRPDEIAYYTEGVREKDALTGLPAKSALSPKAVNEVNLITGGFEAEYNDVLSGVVQVRMKEGNPRKYTGFLSYTTDHGTLDRGQFIDEFDVQFGGPEPITAKLLPALGLHLGGEKSFYVDLGTELSNTYFPNITDIPGNHRLSSGYIDKLFGHSFSYGKFFTPRQDNTWRAAMNYTWKPKGGQRFKIFASKRIQINQGFGDAQVGDVNQVAAPSYPWAYRYALDRYPTQLDDQSTLAFSWSQALSKSGTQELQVARTYSGRQRDVNGKLWYRYEQGFADDLARLRYFYPAGDSTTEGPDWRNNYLLSWTGDYKLTRRWKHNTVDIGTNISFQDAQWARVNCPCDSTINNYGQNNDVFHVYPTTGNIFAQDHVDYQGLSGHFGLGFMYFVPGALADRVIADSTRTDILPVIRDQYYATTHAILGRRVKSRFTPRLAVSYPISDQSKFFFNYGRYAQWPTYYYIYTRINPSKAAQFPQQGNLSLEPKVSVKYEVGVEHKFTPTMALKVTLYNNDIYDELAQRVINSSYVQFYNRAFARSRGVELGWQRRRTGYWSASVDYSYMQARGNSSDPNEVLIARQSGATDFGEDQPREVNLRWNRPHKITTSIDVRVDKDQEQPKLLGVRIPREFGFNLYGSMTSGRAYTPQYCTDRSCDHLSDIGPGLEYSRNGKMEPRFDLRADKTWTFASKRSLKLTLEVYNLFNAKIATRIDPVTGDGYVLGVGAANVDVTRPYNIAYWSNPGYYEAPRATQVGLEWAW